MIGLIGLYVKNATQIRYILYKASFLQLQHIPQQYFFFGQLCKYFNRTLKQMVNW